MWKKVFTHIHEGFAIEVNKDYRGRKAVYSAKVGVPREDHILPFFDPEKLTNQVMLALTFAAQDWIIEDRKYDDALEQKRVEELAGKGRSKNPNANTGLSRFKKIKEPNANG